MNFAILYMYIYIELFDESKFIKLILMISDLNIPFIVKSIQNIYLFLLYFIHNNLLIYSNQLSLIEFDQV